MKMKNSWIIYVVLSILALLLGIAAGMIVSLSKDNRSLREQMENQSSLIEKDLEVLKNENNALYFQVDSLHSAGDSLEVILKEKLQIIKDFEKRYDEVAADVYDLPVDSAMVFFARKVSSEISAGK